VYGTQCEHKTFFGKFYGSANFSTGRPALIGLVLRLVCAAHRGCTVLRGTRAHGVFAPHSKLRAAVTPAHRGVGAPKQPATSAEAPPPPTPKHVAMNWARRLKRVFGIDIESCTRCGGKLTVIASIEEPSGDREDPRAPGAYEPGSLPARVAARSAGPAAAIQPDLNSQGRGSSRARARREGQVRAGFSLGPAEGGFLAASRAKDGVDSAGPACAVAV
jgi:hypothetical protein